MTLWRDGTILHYSRSPHTPILCGATTDLITQTATRDDLLCGLCQSMLADSVGADFWLLAETAPRTDYRTYLQSARWAHLRELALEHYGDNCTLCGRRDDVNVHHRSYDRLGHERLSDLTVLCRGCHARHHDQAA